jgi:hypothetical protein
MFRTCDGKGNAKYNKMVRQKTRLFRTKKVLGSKVTNLKKAKMRENMRIVSVYSVTRNYNLTANILGLSSASLVRYWVNKFVDSTFHCSSIGGDRKSIFKGYEIAIVNDAIATYLKDNPKSRSPDLKAHLEYVFDRTISDDVQKSLLYNIGWSWRVPTAFQIHKYTLQNMIYYAEFLLEVSRIPIHKLKYIDEAHIVSKDLGIGKVLGRVNTRTYVKENTLNESNASLTVMTTLTGDQPIVFSYREESNTQWDFVDFVIDRCVYGDLQPGDTLIVDNAPVHTGLDSYEILKIVLKEFEVNLRKTPVYCPELNAVEFVFAKLKNHLRYHRGDEDILLEVINSLATIDQVDVYNSYLHCICPKVILPDLNL